MNWVWSAIHLDDGTHLHGVDIRIPGMPPIGIGYSQRAGEPLVELQSVTAQYALGADDLPVSTTLNLQPGDIEVTVDIQGHAPVLLVAPGDDGAGRVSQFPRAWAKVRTADGRSGIGWLEWNRNVSSPENVLEPRSRSGDQLHAAARHTQMLGKQLGDGVVGLAVDGTLLNVDGERAVVSDLDQRALRLPGLTRTTTVS